MTDVVNELILQVRQRHPITSVVVTHEMKTVTKVADRVVMIHPLARLKAGESQILYDGPPDGLKQASDPRVQQSLPLTPLRATRERCGGSSRPAGIARRARLDRRAGGCSGRPCVRSRAFRSSIRGPG